MNLADRFFRVAKANLNNILQKIEDPEKVTLLGVQSKMHSGANEIRAFPGRIRWERFPCPRVSIMPPIGLLAPLSLER